jgi:hypothetical protein
MYLVSVILLLFVLPTVCVAVDVLWVGGADLLLLIGKWFVFWAVGVRLFIAGVRQVLQPQFTAESIFEIKDRGAFAIVREVGFGNLAMGTLGLATLAKSGFVVPTAIVGGLYYGLAGAGHLSRGGLNLHGWAAMISDCFIFLVLASFVASSGPLM